MITFPYVILFEFLAPVIEFAGMLTTIYLCFTGGVNWETFWVMLLCIYAFGLMLSSFVVFYDYLCGGSYNSNRSYLSLMFAALLEPFFYHPFIVCFSLRGYFNYIIGTQAVWGDMTRTGAKKKK